MRRTKVLLHFWRVPLTLATLLIALQAAGTRHALEYRRAAVLRGQVWRLITANLVHLGWTHLARDLAGLFLIWALVANLLDEKTWLLVLCTSGFAVGFGLLALSPGIAWYVGISGVLFGLFCAGAICQLQQRLICGSAMLVGMAAILGWTLHTGALPGETLGLGGSVVPQAHLYGALGGATFLLARTALRASRYQVP